MNKAETAASVVREFYQDRYSTSERCVRDVLNYLGVDEKPVAVIFGKCVGWITRTSGSLWATNKRLLWIAGSSMTGYAYNQINSFSASPGWWIVGGTFRMALSNSQEFMLAEVDNKALTRFVEVVRDQMNNRSTQATSSQQSEQQDIAAQLERLSQLKNQGLISEEEFRAAKAKLLDL